MMSAALYVVLAVAMLAIDVAAVENEAPEVEKAKRDVWEIAWSLGWYDHLDARRGRSTAIDKWDTPPWRRERRDAREIYGDAWDIYKRARVIYAMGRKRQVAAALENYRFAVQIYEDARMKFDAAYKAERDARRAVRVAVSEARHAARNAVEKANRATEGR